MDQRKRPSTERNPSFPVRWCSVGLLRSHRLALFISQAVASVSFGKAIGSTKMTKSTKIDLGEFNNAPWPSTSTVKPYFTSPSQRNWAYWDVGAGGLISVDGIMGTELVAAARGRANATLYISGDRTHGLTLFHRLWDGRTETVSSHYSRGDLSRRLEFVKTGDGDLLSVGLFISFEKAWLAVEDFMNSAGSLSKRIEWVSIRDLPTDTFPEP